MLENHRFSKIDFQTTFLILFAAMVPFEFDMLPVMLIWSGFWALSGEYKKLQWKRFGIWSAVFLFYFAMHLAGFIHTENIKPGWIDTRNKLSFLFLPFLLSTYKLTEERRNAILGAYFLSCLSISIVLILRNLGISLVKWETPLTYRNYCLLVHPSYFALYQCWALVIFYCIPVKFRGIDLKKGMYGFIIPFILISSMLFASSKAGLIALVFSGIVLVIRFFLKGRKTPKYMVAYVVLVLVLFVGSTTLMKPSPIKRFVDGSQALFQTEAIDGSSRESTAMRLLIWKSSFEIIAENPVFGVGTGDINHELQKNYAKHNYSYPLLYKLNSHSQFLETHIMIGIPGLIPLILLMFGPFFKSLREKKLLLFVFSGIILTNLSIESMLYQPTACVFYCLFLLLLVKDTVPAPDESNHPENLVSDSLKNLTNLAQNKGT